MAKNFALFDKIFVDAEGVNCMSLEIVRAQKYKKKFEATANRSYGHKLYSVLEFILHHFCKQNAYELKINSNIS